MNAPKIDFDAINRIALTRFESLLEQFFPGGHRVNAEYVVCNPRRNDRKAGSFSINIRDGVWKDFADTNVGGSDPVSLWAYLFNSSGQAEAARILASHLGVPELAGNDNIQKHDRSKRQEWTPILPVPDEAGPAPDTKWTLNKDTGEWSQLPIVAKWAYRTATGALLGYAARVKLPDGDKDVVPLTFCQAADGTRKWKVRSFPKERPLYGLQALHERKSAPVIAFEGEKTTDAGQAILSRAVCVTWPGGSNAVGYVDIEPLRGRKVAIWPDKDEAGYIAALQLARRLNGVASAVFIVLPPEWANDGWDVADEFPDDWNASAHLKAFSVSPEEFAKAVGLNGDEHIQDIPPPPDTEQSAPQRPHEAQGFDGRPIDLFGLSHPPQLPIDVLPDAIADYVSDQADLTGCDHSIIGMVALVAAAACITDSIKLQPKRHDPTWRESARLWLSIVGDPSTRKSPAIKKAVRHVKSMDSRMVENNNSETALYESQLEEWKLLNKEAKKSGSPLPAPKKPAKQRLMVEDVTVEALSDILKDNPRGVLCLKDELTGWFASMDAYKGGSKGASMDRAHWLEAYNGGRRSIDRVVRGSISIPNWSVCMIGGIQEEMIRRIADTMGHDGLLQRFMVVCARPAKKDADRVPNMGAMEAFGELFKHLESLQDPAGEVVTMTDHAHTSRERVSDYARKMISAFDHPHMTAWLGKWDGLFARLCLLYHVLECSEQSVYPTTKQVSGESAARVERLMCGFLLHHAIHFYSEILDANDQSQNTRQLARLILAKKLERLTKRDMAIFWRASRKLNDWEVQKIMNSLSNYGWIEPDAGSNGVDGRPRAWYVNPMVHDLYAKHAERETARRVEVSETLRTLRKTYGEKDPDDPDQW